MDNQLDPLERAKDTLFDLAVRFGPKLLVAILILTAGFFVAGWVGRGVRTPGGSTKTRRLKAMSRARLRSWSHTTTPYWCKVGTFT